MLLSNELGQLIIEFTATYMDMKISCNSYSYIASYMYIDFNFSHAVTDKFLAQLALSTSTYIQGVTCSYVHAPLSSLVGQVYVAMMIKFNINKNVRIAT